MRPTSGQVSMLADMHTKTITPTPRPLLGSWVARLGALVGAAILSFTSSPARASIAYGSINNFDTVNDTGVEAHGFEIELEDTHSTDISYTFDWNHYGTPVISEDNSVPGHPRVSIRWMSGKKPDGTWAAYTAIPSGPIAPTDGHMFTDPSVNFGGEHFGTGYMNTPSVIRYHWLIDNGAGALVAGPAVQVATPVFVYNPPVAAAPAQVQAAIVPPAPAVPDPREFGTAVWVKEIRTTTHNPEKVALRDLVSEDPGRPDRKNWRNGEPDEVEVEWQILQTDHNSGNGGANGELQGAPEDLNNGNEVVTRRYEFFKYIGPIDAETGEAMADSVGPDGIHGKGTKSINGVDVDLSTIEVVGDYTGAQMSAVDVDAKVGLIDHVQGAELFVDYPGRTVVVSGASPFTATISGVLPAGMDLDPVTGVLSGLPTEVGTFTFTVEASDATTASISKTYTLNVVDAAPVIAQATIDTSASPVGSGVTTGDGVYDIGTAITATAQALPGYKFLNWTDHGVIVSTSLSYPLTVDLNHSLVANFVPSSDFIISTSADPIDGGVTEGDGSYAKDVNVTVLATANPGYTFVSWSENGAQVSNSASYTFAAAAHRKLVATFALSYQITTVADPVDAGSTSGDGAFISGSPVTVTAKANSGYVFVEWLENGVSVSNTADYQLIADTDHALVASFAVAPPATPVNSSPVAGAMNQSINPTLTATAFSSTVAGATHAGSQWIVLRDTDGSTVFDSGLDLTHLTSITVPTALATGTSYSWQVSYQDSNGNWSAFSTATSFKTAQPSVTSFTAFKGTYVGLIESDSLGLRGAATVTVTAKGAITSSFTLAGVTTRATGSFSQGGTFTTSLIRPVLPALSVSLALDTVGGSDQITGTISDGTASATVTLNRNLFTRANPVPASVVGTYTLLLPSDPDHTEVTAPQGSGYGRLTVGLTGTVSLSGMLGDGTAFSRSTTLSKGATAPIYTSLFKGTGAVSGWLSFRDTPQESDLDGTLLYEKTAVAAPTARTVYPAGFVIETAVVGSHFTAPAAGTAIVALPSGANNASVWFGSQNLVTPMPVQFVTVDSSNKAITSLKGFTVKFNLKNGGFSGSFIPPGQKRALSFSGIVFQKGDAAGYGKAAGLFTSLLQTASVSLIPAP